MRFEVLAVMLMEIKVVWDWTTFCLLNSVCLVVNIVSYSRRLLLLLEFCPRFAAPQKCNELPMVCVYWFFCCSEMITLPAGTLKLLNLYAWCKTVGFCLDCGSVNWCGSSPSLAALNEHGFWIVILCRLENKAVCFVSLFFRMANHMLHFRRT